MKHSLLIAAVCAVIISQTSCTDQADTKNTTAIQHEVKSAEPPTMHGIVAPKSNSK